MEKNENKNENEKIKTDTELNEKLTTQRNNNYLY